MTDLSLELFVNLDKIQNKSIFSGLGIFDLLGPSLTNFVKTLCESKGATDSPRVLGSVHPSAILEGAVYVAEGASVGPCAYIQGPCYIEPGAEVRHAAFVRGPSYIGHKAVVGHTTEIKGAVFFDEAKAGHFAYVGDSILGMDVNLGAGTKLANLKLKSDEVKFKHPSTDKILPSGLRKFGSIMGDRAQTGCNAVLSPGSILMPGKLVLPCVHHHGTLK